MIEPWEKRAYYGLIVFVAIVVGVLVAMLANA
jgi:hypothetical protein